MYIVMTLLTIGTSSFGNVRHSAYVLSE